MASATRPRFTKKQKAVNDAAWKLIETVRQSEKEGSEKKLPIPELKHLLYDLNEALQELEY